SDAVSAVLDVHDPMPRSYPLQGSSPGIDRPLVRPSDFEAWARHTAKIELTQLIDRRRRFKGALQGLAHGEGRITADLGERGHVLIGLPIALVGEAKLVMTDELIRASLRRSKMQQQGDVALPDGNDSDETAVPDGDLTGEPRTARHRPLARKRRRT